MKPCEHKNAREYLRTTEIVAARDGSRTEYVITYLQCQNCSHLFSRQLFPGKVLA